MHSENCTNRNITCGIVFIEIAVVRYENGINLLLSYRNKNLEKITKQCKSPVNVKLKNEYLLYIEENHKMHQQNTKFCAQIFESMEKLLDIWIKVKSTIAKIASKRN